MVKITLWATDLSPPSWTLRMLAKIIGVELDIKNINLLEFEHMKPEFLKINPMGTIPVIQDGDFIISESHTIMKYLLEKYGSAHKERLYPSEIKARALVDQAMYYDTGVAFIRVKNIALPALFDGATAMGPDVATEIDRTYSTMNMYLEKNTYAAADHLTIADLCLGSTILSLRCFQDIDSSKYPKLAAWLSKLENEPFFQEIAVPGAKMLEPAIKAKWESNAKHD